uniref:Aminopeptidase N n=1 Tax=Brugia timori TaxID=42155 RepID=A0A0R3R4Q3_9BILA
LMFENTFAQQDGINVKVLEFRLSTDNFCYFITATWNTR